MRRCLFCEAKLANKAFSRRVRKKPMCHVCLHAGPVGDRSDFRFKGTTRAGKQCGHYAMEHSEYCAVHKFQGNAE